MREDDAYRTDVTRKALASWERRKAQAVTRWGSLDRLCAKVSPETSAKFAKAMGRMKDAKMSADELEYARRLGVLERGVDAMEAEALKNGNAANDLTWFDLQIKVGGKRAVCVVQASDAEIVAATLGEELGEQIVVYTAADIVMMSHEQPTALTHLKHVVGAYTTHVDVAGNVEASW